MLLNCDVGEDSWESFGLQGYPTIPSSRKSVLNIHWKDWCWSPNSTTLATWCELTHWKRLWSWERLKAGGEGDNRGWDSWMASLTRWTWVWASSRSWWWTEKPDVLQSMGSQRAGHDWVIELKSDITNGREVCMSIKGATGDLVVMELLFILIEPMLISWLWHCTIVLQDATSGGNWAKDVLALSALFLTILLNPQLS